MCDSCLKLFYLHETNMTLVNDCIILGDSSDDECMIIDEIPGKQRTKRVEQVDDDDNDIYIINSPIKSKKQRLKNNNSTNKITVTNSSKNNLNNLSKRKSFFHLKTGLSSKPNEKLKKQASSEAIIFDRDNESCSQIKSSDSSMIQKSQNKQNLSYAYDIIICENTKTPGTSPEKEFLSPKRDSQSICQTHNSCVDSPESILSLHVSSPKAKQEQLIKLTYNSISHYLLSTHFNIEQFNINQKDTQKSNTYVHDVIKANLNIYNCNDLLGLSDAISQAVRFLANPVAKNTKIDVFDMYELFCAFEKLVTSKDFMLKKFEQLVKHVNLDFSIECNRTLNLWEVLNKRLNEFITSNSGLDYNSIEFSCFYELYLRFSLKVLDEFSSLKVKQQKNWLQSLNQYKNLQDKYCDLYNERLYVNIFNLIEITFLKNQSTIYYRDLHRFIFKLDNLSFLNYLFINVFNNGILYENVIFDKYLPLYKKVYDKLDNVDQKFYYLNSIVQLDELRYKLSDLICNSLCKEGDIYKQFKLIISVRQAPKL
jgi:hypothetical protein